MNRNIAVVTVVVVACALGLQTAAAVAQKQAPPSSAALQQFPVPVFYSYEKLVSVPEGCVTATTNLLTRRVWASRLGCAQQVESAGLMLVGLKPNTTVNGARIVATFEVTQLAGGWYLATSLRHGDGSTVGVGQTHIDHTGTYTVVPSSPFTLEAG